MVIEVALTIAATLLVAFAVGLHVGTALGMASLFAGVLFIGDVWDFFGHIPWAVNSSLTMVVVPLFILMGEILIRAGLTEDLYTTMSKWLNRVPGGLLHTNIMASGVFAAVSGSSVATATTIGSVALPILERRKYPQKITLGSIAAGGTLGILIPPSIIMIVYGLVAEVSIGQLYVAAVIPGILLMGLFMLAIAIYAVVTNMSETIEPEATATWGEKFQSLLKVLPIVLLIGAVMGTIYLGIATAIEAAAIGVIGAFLIALWKKRVDYAMLIETFQSTAATTAMVMFIVLGAFLMQSILSLVGLPMAISQWVMSLGLSQLELILLICVVYLLLGTVMDGLAIIVATMPIFLPMLKAAGIDLVWFGIIVVILVELALITPPVGMNIFVIQGIRKRIAKVGEKVGGMGDVFIGVLPFVVAMVVLLAMIIAFPSITTMLLSNVK